MTERHERQQRPVASTAAGGGDPDIAGLTEEILPALVARLRASRLGELEVRTAGWRVRLRKDARPSRPAAPAAAADGSAVDGPDDGGRAARSPAVGYFMPIDGLGTGQLVHAGDPLGSVDVLGIAQDVLAPGGGIVRAVLAEPGQAVEYGQPLVEIDALAVEATVEAADGSDLETAPDVDLGPDLDLAPDVDLPAAVDRAPARPAEEEA